MRNWKAIPDYYLNKTGGLNFLIRCNYDVNNIDGLPLFYRDILTFFTEAQERCNLMATTPSTTPERKNPPKTPQPTFNALQGHKSVDCVVVTNVCERKGILKKQGRCKHSHIAKNCDSKWGCSNFSLRHRHPSVCMVNEIPASDNSPAGVTQPSTQESRQSSSAISMCVDSKTSIQCCKLASP